MCIGRRVWVSILTAVMVLTSFTMTVAAKAAKSEWVRTADGWCYYDSKSDKVKGWNYIGGQTYYFNEKGIMTTGWLYLEYVSMAPFGYHSSTESQYGEMPQNEGWYYFGRDGAIKTGWQKIGGNWYCLRTNGVMYGGVISHYGKEHYGELTRVTTVERKGDSGENSYRLVTSEARYFFDKDGVMATGWVEPGKLGFGYKGKWAYFNSDGSMQTGWKLIDGKWYYFISAEPQGWSFAATGWQKIGGKWYLFNSGCDMVTGWKQSGGKWYYFDTSGAMKTGWLKDGQYWYYLNPNGDMATGKVEIDGTLYVFDDSGVWLGYGYAHGKRYDAL